MAIETADIVTLKGTTVRVKIFNWHEDSNERLFDLYFVDDPANPQTNNPALDGFRKYLKPRGPMPDMFLIGVPENLLIATA